MEGGKKKGKKRREIIREINIRKKESERERKKEKEI